MFVSFFIGWSGELPISMWELEETVTKAYKVILMSLTSTVVNDDTSAPPPFHTMKLAMINYQSLQMDAFWPTMLGYRLPSISPKLGAIDLHTKTFCDVLLPRWYTRYQTLGKCVLIMEPKKQFMSI